MVVERLITIQTRRAGYGLATDGELTCKLPNSEAAFVPSHQIIDLVRPESPVDLLDRSCLGRNGGRKHCGEELIDAFSLFRLV